MRRAPASSVSRCDRTESEIGPIALERSRNPTGPSPRMPRMTAFQRLPRKPKARASAASPRWHCADAPGWHCADAPDWHCAESTEVTFGAVAMLFRLAGILRSSKLLLLSKHPSAVGARVLVPNEGSGNMEVGTAKLPRLAVLGAGHVGPV